MRFFSKIAFITNFCFFVSIIYRIVELKEKAAKIGAAANKVDFNPLVSTVAVLGWVAIFLNIFFVIIFLVQFPTKRYNGIAKFVAYFNLIALPAQVYFYFFT